MSYKRRIRVELVWDVTDKELTFLEFVELPPHVTQREFLDFCIETVERAKRLGKKEQES